MRTHKNAKRKRLKEYDFSKGIQGKYADRYVNSNVVILAPDVAKTFPDSKSVNAALRALQGLAKFAATR